MTSPPTRLLWNLLFIIIQSLNVPTLQIAYTIYFKMIHSVWFLPILCSKLHARLGPKQYKIINILVLKNEREIVKSWIQAPVKLSILYVPCFCYHDHNFTKSAWATRGWQCWHPRFILIQNIHYIQCNVCVLCVL